MEQNFKGNVEFTGVTDMDSMVGGNHVRAIVQECEECKEDFVRTHQDGEELLQLVD